MIDISTLKEYIKVLEDSSLDVIEISDENDTIRLEKGGTNCVAYASQPVAEQIVPQAPAAQPAPAAAPAAPAVEAGKAIKAPIVGVFYVAPSPEAEPYVSVGKKVKKGDVVCIIEAMKCMNEIQAEEDGEITAVLADNGDLVEYGQPLFSIQ